MRGLAKLSRIGLRLLLLAFALAPGIAWGEPVPHGDLSANGSGWQAVPDRSVPAQASPAQSAPDPAPTAPVEHGPLPALASLREQADPETQPAAPGAMRAFVPSQSSTAPAPPGYRLGTGDKLRVTVYGEDDLSGEFDVDSSGYVRLPLIGQVPASGHALRDLEQQITARLADGYLNSPQVSVEVTAYRPFFIIGEINKPGEYPYVNGMSVVTAVALAGGYTYRADDSDVYVRRSGEMQESELPADARTTIQPGDIIRVTERFF